MDRADHKPKASDGLPPAAFVTLVLFGAVQLVESVVALLNLPAADAFAGGGWLGVSLPALLGGTFLVGSKAAALGVALVLHTRRIPDPDGIRRHLHAMRAAMLFRGAR